MAVMRSLHIVVLCSSVLATLVVAKAPVQTGAAVLLVPGDAVIVEAGGEGGPDSPTRFTEVFVLRNASNIMSAWLPKEWSTSINDMTQHINLHVLLVPVIIGFALLILMVSSMVATGHWRWKWEDSPPPPPTLDESVPEVTTEQQKPNLHDWSIPGIVALTSYRFHTGFLSATWMPYLLAMEGHQLMGHRQSFFMGSAKLIYGMSILLNPMFGLVGDQMAVVSHWSGRKLFVIMGVAAGGLGIYGCVVAADIHSVWWYLAATLLWMLGEAMADVTTETLVPELLPRTQYDTASAIRSLNFLLGGLVGYGALIMFRDLHYSWLYYGYLVVMLVCAFLTLCFINTDDLNVNKPRGDRQKDTSSLTSLFAQAYILPARLEGGFPTACSCLFIFSLGSAPMFFLLLMVRDVIGIKERIDMQMHFSMISIVFFVAAAVASVLGVWLAGGQSSTEETTQGNSVEAQLPKPSGGVTGVEEENAESPTSREAVVWRWKLMVMSTVLFGAVAVAIPLVGLLPTLLSRKAAFYFVAILFGLSFGTVYARFQECTWSLLPAGVDVANAMGFAAMCKLAGVGIGNFFAGIILDMFSEDDEASYSLGGYILMCIFCAIVVLVSAKLAHSVSQVALATFDAGKQKV